MELKLFDGKYSVFSLEKNHTSPICIDTKEFYYITRIKEELSIICSKDSIVAESKDDKEWKIIEILKPINLYLVGFISKIIKILEEAKINIFEISSGDREYIMIRDKDIDYACKALICNGYEIV